MTIAVIGAGRHGRAFSGLCARAGYRVVLEDVMPDRLRVAGTELAQLSARIELVSTVEDAVRDADLAVDFVPDELESKLEIWSMIDRMAPPRTVMCTPSETLSVTDLASCTYRADRCVMLRGGLTHGASVRLLTATATSGESIEAASALLRELGFAVMVEQDADAPMLTRNL